MFDAFLSDDHRNTFFHGHSFTANPVGCAAALASMDLLERPECQQQLEWIAEQHGVFKKRLAHHPGLADIRQRGTILALEFQTKEESGYFNQLKAQLVDFFLARGVLLRPLGNVVYILPPYCIQADELQQVYEVLEAALDKFTA
ncbi:MAG: aminotransferase class III-fold pyridoxal phosphate-dependent enzyme [Bacteroidota bacterium]